MNTSNTMNRGSDLRHWVLAAFIGAACMVTGARGAEIAVVLSGAQEVPPVTTSAAGKGTITIADDGAVSGSVTTSGIDGTAAHIHLGAPGQNGGVAIPLAKSGDGAWAVPGGAKLNVAQQKAFKDGQLYVNVHSKAHPDGEIRGQLRP